MRFFVQCPPGDTRPLPGREHLHRRPEVLGLGATDDRLQSFVAGQSLKGVIPWVEVGTVPEVERASAAGAGLWLRGLEAGGPTGDVGAIVLIRAAHTSGRPFVVEGLGRRGMAAALAVGAYGVQLDVHTWLADGSPLCESHRERLAGRTARDVGFDGGVRSLGGAVLTDWPTRPDSGIPASLGIADLTTGPLDEVLHTLIDDVLRRVQLAREHHPLRSDPFGTGTPIVQGPMANVSEGPALALAVREAGALPFCALGALRAPAADEVLAGMSAVPEPWGVGVIGFDVMPWRDAHLAAIPGSRPIILAGGSPQLAVDLQERGQQPWLHTPSARLLRMAITRGVQAAVLEGREAGGHVGSLPSSALWEEGLAVLEAEPSSRLLVLAGGIGDAVSAAFAGAMSAQAHQHGHRIGLQVGTAFFFTHEIVEAGQITSTYQQQAVRTKQTTIVGDTVGLPMQCAPNGFTRAVQAEEQLWLEQAVDRHQRRERLESHNLGRTRLAAKGIERDPSGGHRRVPVRGQLENGAFTMGQGAAVQSQLSTVGELVQALTVGAARLLGRGPGVRPWSAAPTPVAPRPIRSASRVVHQADQDEPIAIVGIGCVLPGAPNVPAFLDLLTHGMNAITAVPDARWLAHRYFHPSPEHASTTSYVRMAGVVHGFHFDSPRFGIPPAVVQSMDRAQQFALVAVAEALQGVRIADRSRAAVIIGNTMGGEHNKSLAVRVRFREVLAALGHDGDSALDAQVDRLLGQTLPPVDVESVSGLLSNVIAGRVASWLDLGGANFTVDAACAASFGALSVALDLLRQRRADVVITGGVDADLAPETFVGFCRTHALSPTGSQPFSTRADGFVMGEGAAMFALKRLSDAQAQGDHIHALVRGIGQSSDGRSSGITAPRASGQSLAVRRALAASGIDPAEVHLLEAHGTGTALGDQVETDVLASHYPGAWIGSVKSQIGHLKGGAGAAGLLKAVLSLSTRTVFPTLNAGPVRPGLGLLVPRSAGRLEGRFAAVSAFGFGGTNHHVLLETGTADPGPPAPGRRWESGSPLLQAFGAEDRATLARRVATGQCCTPEEACERAYRAVSLDNPPGFAAWIEGGGRGAYGTMGWLDDRPAQAAVLVFPGQGSPRRGAADVLMQIPKSAAALRDLGETDPDPSSDPAAQHHLLVATAIAYGALLSDLPVAGVIGHSVGELGALAVAGRYSASQALALADARGAALHRCARGAMVAVSGELQVPPGCFVAARNSPGSWVLAGPPDAIAAADLSSVKHTALDVERAFHTPAVQPAADALALALEEVELNPGARWWSNVPGVDPEASGEPAKQALVQAVTAPVGFQESVSAAYAEGCRLFVHMGPGASLVRHVERCAAEATVVALHSGFDPDGRELVRSAAQLLALGHAQLLRSLPGTWVQVAFPREIPTRPTPTGPTAYDALPEPVAVVAPEPTPALEGVDPGSVRDLVLASISEVTGYPRAALLGTARLDTDLGIDSIRKLEILGTVQERLDVQIDERALAEVQGLDIDGLIAHLEAPAPKLTTAQPAPSQRWGRTWRPIHDLPSPAAQVLRAEGTDAHALLAAHLGRPLADDTLLLADPDEPAHHALAALLRVAAHEQGVRFQVHFGHDARFYGEHTAVWSAPPGQSAGEQRWVAGPAPLAPNGNLLPHPPIVLASGGTSGILSSCLAALPGARGVVLGRRTHGEPPPGFDYVSCDVTDPAAVVRAAAVCRERHGPIDLVVHAAGLLRDGPLAQATPADLLAVLAVKEQGARNLIAATLEDAPARFVVFSSVSATLTNPGQALYAAANALAEQLVHPTAHATVPLAWTAWRDVGMASDPALQRLLATRGIHALIPEEGAAHFVQALHGESWTWIAHGPPPGPVPWPLTVTSTQLGIALDPTAPFLRDHTVAGAALVPAAHWIRAFQEVHGAGRTTILAPTFVRAPLQAELLDTEVRVSERVVARFEPMPCDPPNAPDPADSTVSTELYSQHRLFHGPTWQVLSEVGLADERAWATLVLTEHDPVSLAIDAVYQLLALWSGENTGWMALPVAGTWGLPRPGRPARVMVQARATPTGVTGRAWVFDTNHECLLFGDALELTRATRWSPDA